MTKQIKKTSAKKLKTEKIKFDLSDYKLNDTDTEIFRLKNTYYNISHTDISGLLGITLTGIHKAINKPAYKLAEKNFKLTWIETIINARKKAADKIVSLINHNNPSISLRACESILQLDKFDITADTEEQPPY